MAAVRNPIASLMLTILGAAFLSILAALPVLLLAWIGLAALELGLFYLAFAAFVVGMASGRATFLGSLGFTGGFLGGFVGFLLFQALAWPTGSEFLFALGLAALCGLGGLATGRLGVRRVERAIRELPKLRRCGRCGTRVGLSARRCWSCKAHLPPM